MLHIRAQKLTLAKKGKTQKPKTESAKG